MVSEAVESVQRRMQTVEAQQIHRHNSEAAVFPHMRWKGTRKWQRLSVRALSARSGAG